MRKFMLGALIFLMIGSSALAEADQADDVAAIESIMTQFSSAIEAKDAASLNALFLSSDTPFVLPAVYLPDGRRHSPENGVQIKDAQTFIEGIIRSEDITSEQFSEVNITVHEDLATMTARYDFIKNGEVANDGYESWSLAKTGENWKIISVMWTGHLPRK